MIDQIIDQTKTDVDTKMVAAGLRDDVTRYCPGTFRVGSIPQFVTLRYTPRTLGMKNKDTF